MANATRWDTHSLSQPTQKTHHIYPRYVTAVGLDEIQAGLREYLYGKQVRSFLVPKLPLGDAWGGKSSFLFSIDLDEVLQITEEFHKQTQSRSFDHLRSQRGLWERGKSYYPVPSRLSLPRISLGTPKVQRNGYNGFKKFGDIKLDNLEVFGQRLQRLGYDQANAYRILQAIEKGGQIVIVGENMIRVNAVKRMIEAAGGVAITYSPRNFTGQNRNSEEANRSWIRRWAREKGIPVVDIGRQPAERVHGHSPFYGIENRSLNRWGIYTPFDYYDILKN